MSLEIQKIISDRLQVSYQQIVSFCQHWELREFALFGSVLRDDFNNNSDIDVLVQFPTEHKLTLFDVIKMKKELEKMFGRSVDLLEKEELKNPYRRAEILQTLKSIYVYE